MIDRTDEPAPWAVLIVDDAIVIRRILTMTLRDMPELRGATIDEAENDAVAFEKLRAKRYDLVMSEVRTPGIDGGALVERVRRELHDTRTPMLLINRQEEEAGADAVLRAAASAFVPKPLSPHRIKEAVRRILKAGQSPPLGTA